MKLFVAGLPYDMDDAELMEFFEKFGTVASAKVTMDKETGKSRGFAFVEMPMEEQAREAIEGLNNLGIGKKVMIVKPAEERRGPIHEPSSHRPRFASNTRPPRDHY
jgi:RNA recognition motif-containing protein